MEVPFWEETYKDDTVFTFGNQPNQSITAIENLLDKSGRVLDVGCGDGKNSLYLAKQGFRNIDAFDLSVNAIEKLRRLAVAHSLEINAWTGNLCSFSFVKEYSLIMSFGTLHFVSKNDWHNFIMKSKKATAVGGFHIMQLILHLFLSVWQMTTKSGSCMRIGRLLISGRMFLKTSTPMFPGICMPLTKLPPAG